MRGMSTAMPYSDTLAPVRRTLSISAKTGLSGASRPGSGKPSSMVWPASKNISAARLV
jgi:hypothetical protein